LIGIVVGNLASHEAGHLFGNYHVKTEQFNIMDPSSFGELGPDGLFGTADDPEFTYKTDIYSPPEGDTGVEDTLNTIAVGLSTGKQAGTYYDFTTGTLYVTGSVNNGPKDTLKVETTGTNLQVYIDGKLSLTRPTAGVNRVFLNGSNGPDELDASGYSGPTTLEGRGGNDQLAGGDGDDLLFGDEGNDQLSGGAGKNILVGGDGNDALTGGSGVDLMIGGSGADRLYGNNEGDLLIAGRTSYDSNSSALSAVMAEWSSARSYETRVNNLRGVGSQPRDNGNSFLTTSGSQATVFNDDSVDVLAGGSGRDWFFAATSGKAKDLFLPLAPNEFVDG
jgi:Ca2+-binding RTX toxin-like protein